MVYLSPRFLFLAALVAAAATPSFVLQSDARAVNLAQRHHDKSTHDKHSVSSFASKGSSKVQDRPTIPLPPSSKTIKGEGKTSKKHKKGKKNQGRDDSASIGGDFNTGSVRRRDPHSEHHHHHHHHHGRQEAEGQSPANLDGRVESRIYGKRERKIEGVDKQGMLNVANAKSAADAANGNTWDKFDPLLTVGKYEIGNGRQGSFSKTHSFLPRSPVPRHHHHHDKVVVNGDNDKVHVHERREPRHHHHHHDKVIVNGSNDDVRVHEKREPRHHHHHDHHVHDKTVINGDNDDVHIHERRDPRHHHHHHGEHKTVINGDNDDVHIHNKRAVALENMPGVPGTIDIMAFGGNMMEKLASLILSAVPANSTATNSSTPLSGDGTKAANETDGTTAALSPFVLDASNSTQTQFFLVSEAALSTSSAASTSYTNTLSVLKSAASSKNDVVGSQDIKVTLQVMVFEPTEAAMQPYCATFDPNPPAPAPLTMERCSDSSSDPQNAGKMTEASLHKSQTFLYNPISGILRPKWFGVTSNSPLNTTEPSASVPLPTNGTSSSSASVTTPSPTSTSTSGGTMDAKQMNFKIPTSNKNAPAHLPGPVSGIVGNMTQTVNGTLPSNSSLPAPVPSAPVPPNPMNVTLVFTPAAMAIHSVNGASGVTAFVPADNNSTSTSNATDTSGSEESESTSDSDLGAGGNAVDNNFMDVPSSSASSTSSDFDSYTSSASATTTDTASMSEPTGSSDSDDFGYSGTPAAKADDPTSESSDSSDATSVSASVSITASTDASATTSMPTSTDTDITTMTIDEAAMEKMYQQPRVSVSA